MSEKNTKEVQTVANFKEKLTVCNEKLELTIKVMSGDTAAVSILYVLCT